MLIKNKTKNNWNFIPFIVPKEIANKIRSDCVSFSATNNKTEEKKEYAAQACYASYMNTLSENMFTCYPQSTFSLPNDVYLKWMNLCKINNLLPISSEFFIEKNKPIARIPGGNESKHRIYTALCCYRFAESIAPLAYEAVGLSDNNPQLDFYQIIHYVLCKYVTHTGHSFSHLCTSGYEIYSLKNERLNLASSITMKWWFEIDRMGKSSCGVAGTGYTSDALRAYKNKFNKFDMVVKNIEDVLDPKYTPLYKTKKEDVDEVNRLYKNL